MGTCGSQFRISIRIFGQGYFFLCLIMLKFFPSFHCFGYIMTFYLVSPACRVYNGCSSF